ncbi:MAG: sulfotransferase [Promethearchaeota archaeon]
MKNKLNTPPIIIIGMHRSGTSMITGILKKIGLFIGWELGDHYEARFFLHRNEKILKSCNSGWDNPDSISYLLNHKNMRKKLTEKLKKDLNSINSISFLGLKYYLKYRSIFNINLPWGWKDPRNTLLLPIWLDIFPNAKIIHIYRNGIDVSQSLYVREIRRINKVINEENKISERTFRQPKLIKKYGLSNYVINQIRRLSKNLDPLSEYEKYIVHSCISREKSFEIWNKYLDYAFKYTSNLNNQVLKVKYEDFVLNPEVYLKKMISFCNLSPNKYQMESLNQFINPNRAYAFKNNESLYKFYEMVRNNHWMKKLGYNNIK